MLSFIINAGLTVLIIWVAKSFIPIIFDFLLSILNDIFSSIFSFLFWIIKTVLLLLFKVALFFIICILVFYFLFVFIPGYLDEIAFIVFLIFLAINGIGSKLSSGSTWNTYTGSTYSSTNNYVLNKKTGVIHHRWSTSADTISDKHRKEISYYDAEKLIENSKKYHYKKEP